MRIPYKIKRKIRGVKINPRGQRIYYSLTFRCNLDCSYCCIKWHNGTLPITTWIIGDEWNKITDDLYCDVKEIVLAGGEPMLHPDFVMICNHILSRGLLLNIDTNLLSRKGLEICKSDNIIFYTSKHKEMTDNQVRIWEQNFRDYKEKFGNVRCDYPNIDDKLLTKEQGYDETFKRFRVMFDPAGKVYASFYELMKEQYYGLSLKADK